MSDKKTEKKLKCHDCGVERGQLHRDGCDWEICYCCGRQLLSCDCDLKIEQSKRIPYGTVREIAARIPYYSGHTMEIAKKDLLESIEDGLW